MCGKDLMQAAGTVTKKLAKWLVEKGYIEDTENAGSAVVYVRDENGVWDEGTAFHSPTPTTPATRVR